MSWDYPVNKGLKDLISRVNLHPITCLSSLSDEYKQKLLEQNIVFCTQLSKDKKALERLGMDSRSRGKVQREANEICNSNHQKQ
ncbi:MAG: hypothetical protein ACNS64_15645 [Candidatus Halalkalibacterium sp. M3_1C_030]